MPEPKKPLITRERYRQYKRDQANKTESDGKKTKPPLKAPERSVATAPEKTNRQAPPADGKNSTPPGKKRPENGIKAKITKLKTKLFRKAEKQPTTATAQRLSDKERGRRLDSYLNKAILIVILLIILVFAIAFVL